MSYDSWEVPDAIEPMTGYRGWLVKHDTLRSVWSDIRDVEWPARQALHAECINPTFRRDSEAALPLSAPPEHDRPIRACSCGIYAMHELPRANRPWPREAILGVVEGWGHIIVGTKGFRAEYARPVALVARRPNTKMALIVERIANKYELDIVDARELKLGGYVKGERE